jgi:predicted Ser/Thr protein kinase
LGRVEKIADELLSEVSSATKAQFEARRSILSFDEYLDLVVREPRHHLRSAAQYLSDVVDHFGAEAVELPTGEFTRYRLFDVAWDEGRGRVVGQERVQGSLIRLLQNFVRAGRTDRLLLLHGPNGSAKTSLIQAITKAAEAYSETADGALYRFNWVFPSRGVTKGSLGFGGSGSSDKGDSYAHLEGEAIDARVPCELKDHPLLLLRPDQRAKLFEQLDAEERLPRDHAVPEVLKVGDLSAKNRRIYDALMADYHGDVGQVLRHVQVERFYLSRRYRTGVVAVEPQMSVDAYARQVTADRSLASLPPSLQHTSLYETGGALSDANRGVLEFNDLLKRPLDTWKYLLVATEQAQASLDAVNVFLDVVMVATSNDVHLNAFKEHPDWPSFKGRIELVTAPYLLRARDEQAIYEDQVPRALTGLHLAPHALEVAARWAVLTRLEPPDPEAYDENVRELVSSLSASEKLDLYDTGTVPERLSQRERRDLRQIADALYAEHADKDEYEGRYGASVREVRTLLLNAAQDARFDHLSPIAVLDQLRGLVKEKSSYQFLRRDPVRGYRDAARFVDLVEVHYVSVLDEEVRTAMGLVKEGSHTELFEKYLKHISAWTKGEKLPHPHTGKMVDPDSSAMKDVERVLLAEDEDADDFRRSIISQIGAYRLEHPDDDVDYELLFGSYMRRLKEDFYDQRKKVVEKLEENFLKVLDGDDKGIEAKDLEQVQTLRENMAKAGYNDASARSAIAYLLNKKR